MDISRVKNATFPSTCITAHLSLLCEIIGRDDIAVEKEDRPTLALIEAPGWRLI
jgi:hypothetical protein